MVCFHFILGHIERIGGPGEILRFHRFVADVLHRRAVGNMDIGLSKTGDVFVLRQGKSPLSMRKWALHVLDEIRAYECAGAPLNRARCHRWRVSPRFARLLRLQWRAVPRAAVRHTRGK